MNLNIFVFFAIVSKKRNKKIMNFTFKLSVKKFVKNYIKFLFFKKITENGLNLIFRNKDIITPYPATSGVYDEHIKIFLTHVSKKEYSDFLIDIGANIGLTSCQSGDNFKQIHMFEPNSDCFKILEVNSKIALKNTDYFLYNFGLGEEDGTFKLSIPDENWGGGYIKHESNPIHSKISQDKENKTITEENTNSETQVQIKNAGNELRNIFYSLEPKNLTKGIIKIDVEGLETPIIRAIAKIIPDSFELIIIFETWDKKIDIDSLILDFKGRAKAFKFSQTTLWKKDARKISKLFSLLGFFLGKPAITHKIEEISKGEQELDYIIRVSKK